MSTGNCHTLLTHWGRVMHICVGKLTIMDSDNGLSPGQRQAIIWTNAGILLTGPLGTNFNEILIGIQTFSFKKMLLKMSSAKWRSFCLGLNALTICNHDTEIPCEISLYYRPSVQRNHWSEGFAAQWASNKTKWTWWRHQMETFSTLLALSAVNSPVTGEFPPQRPVTWSFDVFFDLSLNQQLSKQWGYQWFEKPSSSLWRYCNGFSRFLIVSLNTLVKHYTGPWYQGPSSIQRPSFH